MGSKHNTIVPIKRDTGAFKNRRLRKSAAPLYDKSSRLVTVMFTYMNNTADLLDNREGLTTRILFNQHNNTIHSIIKTNRGVPVKNIGSGIVSYFESAEDALAAGIEMQIATDRVNILRNPDPRIIMSIGMHTGNCSIREGSIIGSPVNSALHFESMANPGEIYISEETYQSLQDKNRGLCRFKGSAYMKGSAKPVNVYTAFWSIQEIEAENEDPVKYRVSKSQKFQTAGVLRLFLVFFFPVALMFLFSQLKGIPDLLDKPNETRSIFHSIDGLGRGEASVGEVTRTIIP